MNWGKEFDSNCLCIYFLNEFFDGCFLYWFVYRLVVHIKWIFFSLSNSCSKLYQFIFSTTLFRRMDANGRFTRFFCYCIFIKKNTRQIQEFVSQSLRRQNPIFSFSLCFFFCLFLFCFHSYNPLHCLTIIAVIALKKSFQFVSHTFSSGKGPYSEDVQGRKLHYEYGVHEMQGKRPYMEDRHVVHGMLGRFNLFLEPQHSFYLNTY